MADQTRLMMRLTASIALLKLVSNQREKATSAPSEFSGWKRRVCAASFKVEISAAILKHVALAGKFKKKKKKKKWKKKKI